PCHLFVLVDCCRRQLGSPRWAATWSWSPRELRWISGKSWKLSVGLCNRSSTEFRCFLKSRRTTQTNPPLTGDDITLQKVSISY
ncbi:hypothetical protein GQ607_001737, partial [Colletotrichum asianum]